MFCGKDAAGDVLPYWIAAGARIDGKINPESNSAMRYGMAAGVRNHVRCPRTIEALKPVPFLISWRTERGGDVGLPLFIQRL
jgi:hypothetical protein